MKKCKEQFCRCFIQRANTSFELLEGTIREKEHEIRSHYVGTIVSSISSDDFVTMIVVDGTFILEYFLRHSNPHLVENDPMIEHWMHPILKFDLALLENQLPLFVLDMLLKQANPPAELGLKPLSLMELAFKFFECYNFQMVALVDIFGKIEHFTDLVRLFYLGGNLPDREVGGAKLSYFATQLREAGVKLKGVKFDETIGYFADRRSQRIDIGHVGHVGLRRWFLDLRFLPQVVVDRLRLNELMKAQRGYRRFLDIRFNNGVLEIPCITLNDERIRLIRNIIALEQSSHYVGHAYVTDFFVFLGFLIDTSKDVDFLI